MQNTAKTRKVIELIGRDIDSEATNLASQIIDKINSLAEEKSYVTFALCGGSSPKPFFQSFLALAGSLTEDARSKLVFLPLDERAVPPTNEDFNLTSLRKQFLQPLLDGGVISEEQIFWYYLSEGSRDLGLSSFQQEFAEKYGRIDIVLGGVGPDGHIASLFPNHPSLEEDADTFFLVTESPKHPPTRISASRTLIVKAPVTIAIFLKGKEEAFADFNDKSLGINDCPAKLLALSQSADGVLYLLREAPAAED